MFDPHASTIIYTDANLVGAASMFCQPEKVNGKTILYPIAFYSVRFTPTQQRYATMERELCAVMYTLDGAHLFISLEITVYTDN